MKTTHYYFQLKAMNFWNILCFILCISSIAAQAQDNVILYRINGGGEKIEDEPIGWEADLTATRNHGVAKKGKPSPYLTITFENEQDLTFAVPSFTGTNSTEYPNSLFATERFSTYRNKISQTWDFPVSVPGTYTINLLFAEVWEGSQNVRDRVFGVSIEDSTVTESLDLVAEVGWNVATVKSYDIEVTDGNIDIDLLRIVQNPAVKGIEIIGPTGANQNTPPLISHLPLIRAEGGTTINTSISANEEDGDPVSLAFTVKDQNGITIDPGRYTFTDNGDGTGSLVWETEPTDVFFYTATVTATDKDGTDSRSFTIIVSEKVKNILYRVNVGGSELEDALDASQPPFTADAKGAPSPYVTGGEVDKSNNVITPSPSVPAYVPPALFQSERYWSQEESIDGKWSFEVPDGQLVSVRLFLAEVFLSDNGNNSNAEKGPRKFDIIINEDTVEKALDIFEEVGQNVGIMRTYSVISDGTIDISFGYISEKPNLKGIELINIEPLSVTVNKVDASCFGGKGSASIDVSGGIGPYEIIWENNNNATPEELLAGTYTVTIKDASGQQVIEEVTINEPEALSVTIETTDASAIDANDGMATATITGGTEPYALDWGEGINPEALSAGLYVLTVTDANDCTTTEEFAIGDPDTLVVDVKVTNPTCKGDTGSAEVNATGGIAPYTIEWGEGIDPVALIAGEYTVIVTDKTGKQVEKKIEITEPETALTIKVSATDATASGATDGSASVSVEGGTSPYNIFWGDINPTNLAAGTYTVTVKDAAGCEKEEVFTIEEPEALTAEVTKTDATCDEAGSASVTVNGGIPPYEVNWSDDADPENLTEGTYQVTITDANGVSINKEVAIILDCDEPVGTEDPTKEDLLLKVYPVPGDGLLHINVETSLADKEGALRIYSLYGQVVYQQKINTWKTSIINVSSLSTGTYILEVETKDTILKRRLLIQ